MKSPKFRPVSAEVAFPKLEERILEYWRQNDIIAKGLNRNPDGPEWVFYEGPPTANGLPHLGHIEARSFKDIFPRFHAMRGSYVHRKGGWDCHGLPVELEVEKQLGINSKQQIEEYGVEKFNALCRESVQRYVEEWTSFTERIGMWIDMDDPYVTMDPEYVQSVWWSLKELYERDLLFEDYRSAPYCPRCETALSNHEMDQPDAWKTVKDPSVFVRLPLKNREADLLVWTTTPWTLPSNLAAAVHPDFGYSIVKTDGRPVIVASSLLEAVMGEDAEVLETIGASELVGAEYEPPFSFARLDKRAWFVIAEEFVTIEDGTGIVHIAPAYGSEDLEAGKRNDLPFLNLVDRSGRFVDGTGDLTGKFVKEADASIIDDLAARGVLFKSLTYEHNYPHCWRCKTPLLYYALTSWYVRTTARKDELLAENEKTNWHPDNIKRGRYGEWLRNNVDWALSRNRYWGTPLPVWKCKEGHITLIGSFAELSERAGRDLSDLDPHRPYVDEVLISCSQCSEEAARVSEVIDTWYDSGSMPFAQWGYPFKNKEVFERRFPADFIAEAIDQTRGWFYTLMANSTLLFGKSSYRNVLCFGLIVGEGGKKISKSEDEPGDVDPWVYINRHGSDALRWWTFTSGSPWANRSISPGLVDEFLRRYLLTLWNTYSFFVTYASIDGFDPGDRAAPAQSPRPEIDHWILSELNEAISEVTKALDAFDALSAGRRLEAFVDDLSNWYVRRTRSRFWKAGADDDKLSAYRTLHECLVKVAKMTAPFTPFIAEEIYTNLTGRQSVHLDDWPAVDEGIIDEGLMERMRLARRLVFLGRSARSSSGLKTRQPLAKATVAAPERQHSAISSLIKLISGELNVKAIEVVDSLEEFLDYSVKPDFSKLGPRLGARVTEVAKQLEQTPISPLLADLAERGKVTIQLGSENIVVTKEELDVRTSGKEGFAAATEGELAVALDLEVTEDLRREGLARGIVRGLNDARKEAGLQISDRIVLYLKASGELDEARKAHAGWISEEVLAVELTESEPEGSTRLTIDIDGRPLVAAFVKSQT